VFVWRAGMGGSGLPSSTRGMVPLAHGARECPCDFEAFTAIEGPQIVSDLDFPGSTNVSAPNGVNVLKVLRQLEHYPYDLEDGRLVYEAENSPGTPFPTTAVAGEIIHEDCDGVTGIYGTALVAPADLDELDEEGPVQPLSVTVRWVSGGFAQTLTDDGLGVLFGFAGSGTINYCTKIITLDLATPPIEPDALTDITIDYTAMDDVQISTRTTGTISGGRCTDDGVTSIDYEAWDGWVAGTRYQVVAGSVAFVALGADTYWVVVNSTGSVVAVTSITVGDELLCKVIWSGAAFTLGPLDIRMELTVVNDTTGEPLDFYYYVVFIWDNVTLNWHRCSPTDYALAYYSQDMIRWLWLHLPGRYHADDAGTLQQILTEQTLDDGQVINMNEDSAVLHGQLYRFLKWFGLQGAKSRAYIKSMAVLYTDIDKCPEEWLHVMAGVLDFTLPRAWDVMRKRYFIKQCTGLYKLKGTEGAIVEAAYRASGLVPQVTYMHERLLYSYNQAWTFPGEVRGSWDTSTVLATMETASDTGFYGYGPDRGSHYHERGVNLYFTGAVGPLAQAYSRTLIVGVQANSGPIYRVDDPAVADRLISPKSQDLDYILPGSLTISWTDSGAVARSMSDDGLGGFLAGGDGDPANSSVNYKSLDILLKTVALGINHLPGANTDITCTFTSTSRGVFHRMEEEIRKSAGATLHFAYYVNDLLVAESD